MLVLVMANVMIHADKGQKRMRLSLGLCVLGGVLVSASGATLVLAALKITGMVPSLGGVALPHRVGWPMLTLLVGMGLLAAGWPSPKSPLLQRWQDFIRSFSQLWNHGNLIWRIVITALIGHLAISLAYFLGAPVDLHETFVERANLQGTLLSIRAGQRYVHWEFLARLWKETIPPRAAVAYRGHWEGPLVAYELYPRRLYLLPEDGRRLAANWHNHRWLAEKTKGKSLADRSTDEFWTQRTIWPSLDLETFIQQRHIEFLLTFDEADEKGCSLQAMPDSLRQEGLKKDSTPPLSSPQ